MSVSNTATDVTLVLPSYGGNLLFTPPDLHVEVQKSFGGQYYKQVDLIDINRRNDTVILPPCSILSPMRLIEGNGATVMIPSGLQLDNVSGRTTISNAEYIKFINEHQVDALIAYGDNISLNSSKSKVRKASDRCLKWLEELQKRMQRRPSLVFGVAILCSQHSDVEIENEIKRLTSDGKCNGIVIGGAYADDESEEILLSIIKKVKFILNQDIYNEKSIPILVQGPKSLNSIISCINAGANFVATSLPKILTDNKEALIYDKQVISNEGNDNQAPGSKRSHDSIADISFDFNVDKQAITTINLTDEVFKKDLTPLLRGCECHACRNHTRAYIHHLLNTKEMLAEILLYTHNQFHLLRLITSYNNSQNKLKQPRQEK